MLPSAVALEKDLERLRCPLPFFQEPVVSIGPPTSPVAKGRQF